MKFRLGSKGGHMTRRTRWNLIQLLVAVVLMGSSVSSPAEAVGSQSQDPAAVQQLAAPAAQTLADRTSDVGPAGSAPSPAAPTGPAAPAGGSIITIPLAATTPKIDGL